MLGAGGVGKAIVYGLIRRGAQRRGRPTASAAGPDSGPTLRLPHASTGRPGIPSRPTCCSTARRWACIPNVDETPFEKHHLRPSMIVFDAVYNPENTLLVKEARSRNCTVVTGVDMFVRQACRQFELFTGKAGPADLMRETHPPGDRRGEVSSHRRTNSRIFRGSPSTRAMHLDDRTVRLTLPPPAPLHEFRSEDIVCHRVARRIVETLRTACGSMNQCSDRLSVLVSWYPLSVVFPVLCRALRFS